MGNSIMSDLESLNEGARMEEEYVANNGLKCPYCGSRGISTHEGSMVLNEDATIDLHVECDDCTAEWAEIYTLTGLDLGDEE